MRRCGWCGVQLRWWQLNHCKRCHIVWVYDTPSPPFTQASRWHAKPDQFKFGVE